MNFLEYTGITMPEGLLYPLVWLVALVLAIIIAMKYRGKAGKFLLIICGVIFGFNMIVPFLFGLLRWLMGVSYYYENYFYVVLNVIGIILLVIAFWIKPSLKEYLPSEREEEEKR